MALLQSVLSVLVELRENAKQARERSMISWAVTLFHWRTSRPLFFRPGNTLTDANGSFGAMKVDIVMVLGDRMLHICPRLRICQQCWNSICGVETLDSDLSLTSL